MNSKSTLTMRTIMSSNIYIVILLLIAAANIIARSVNNQMSSKERVNPLMQRNQMDNVSCAWTVSFLQICPNTVMGVTVFFAPFANDDCDGIVPYKANMSITNINDDVHTHHFQGNITIECDSSTHNVSGQVYFGSSELNGTITMCGDTCETVTIDGEYSFLTVGECYEVGVDGAYC